MTDQSTWEHLATIVSGALGGGALLKVVQAVLRARNARHRVDTASGLQRLATDSEVGMGLRDELRREVTRLREEVESLNKQVAELTDLVRARAAAETATGLALAAATRERDELRLYARECEGKLQELQATVTRLSLQKRKP